MTNRLYRIRSKKMIAGVASGLSEYFDIDPVFIRVAFIVLTLTHGVGLIAYIILWVVMPEKIEVAPETGAINATDPVAGAGIDTQFREQKRNSRFSVAGIILIVLGLLFLAENFIPIFDLEDFWPVLLIAVGIGILWNTVTHHNKAPEVQNEIR
jgi:phage shock protein C